jgi:hypothetical protein
MALLSTSAEWIREQSKLNAIETFKMPEAEVSILRYGESLKRDF